MTVVDSVLNFSTRYDSVFVVIGVGSVYAAVVIIAVFVVRVNQINFYLTFFFIFTFNIFFSPKFINTSFSQ